jgi:phosphoglucomutase
VLADCGYEVIPVLSQCDPDPAFSGTESPNPESPKAYTEALKIAKETGADIVITTDPDCDRVGIAVKDGDDYALMSGNAVGCLLLEYILSCKTEAGTLPENPVAVKTIVTTALAARIAEHYGCELRNILTGFKYIGEQIGLLEAQGAPERYVLGFEESYGYLAGTHARDKDAVVASMLICEMAAYYLSKGETLLQVYDRLCQQYGFYTQGLVNVQFEGAAGMKKMAQLMENLRQNRPENIGGKAVVGFADYRESYDEDYATGAKETLHLPKSNVLTFRLEEGAQVIFRPSGTEPKMKAYITAIGDTKEAADSLADTLSAAAKALLV